MVENDKLHGSLVFSAKTNEDQNTSSNDLEHDHVAEYQSKTIGSGLETIPRLNLSKLHHSFNEQEIKNSTSIIGNKNFFDFESQVNVKSSMNSKDKHTRTLSSKDIILFKTSSDTSQTNH